MPIPPLVASGQIISASHVNGIRNFLPLMADGTAGTPGLRFEDDPDTGLHRPGSNQLAIVTGGAVRVTVGDAGVDLGGHALSALGAVTMVGGYNSDVLTIGGGDIQRIALLGQHGCYARFGVFGSAVMTDNYQYNYPTPAQDNPSYPSWILAMDHTADSFVVARSPAGSVARTNFVVVNGAGAIQMLLGGALKTLSVDGSGFVKAT
jgi:hypothetical protein